MGAPTGLHSDSNDGAVGVLRAARVKAFAVHSPPSAAAGAAARADDVSVPPLAPPPFTLADIRGAIPPHLFERSALRSFSHVLRDVAAIGVLAALNAVVQSSDAVPWAAKLAAWPLYWYLAGAYAFGLWILAHECGHQAFSAERLINDSVGLVLHSVLLVPYHSWAITHSRHHAGTCSVEDDEAYVPHTRDDYGLAAAVADSPLGGLWHFGVMLLLGWPMYLIGNFTGPPKNAGGNNSHFWPWSRLFTARQAPLIALSVLGVAAMLGALAAAAYAYGAGAVALWYGGPYLVVNALLVIVTYLQHTDERVPHYRAPAFTWLRGALSTVDRSFGAFLDDASHHIADSHVVHHLFHTMPFYNAVLATPHVRAFLGPYYLSSDRWMLPAMWDALRTCHFIEDEGEVVFYKKFGAPKPHGKSA